MESSPASTDLDIKYQPRETLDLMMGVFSGGETDDFSTATRILPPLLLTQMLQGVAASAAESPLFSLPDELLHSIVTLLSSQDLASLAYVNSDCRQLARAVQFEHVKLDYWNWELLFFLVREGVKVDTRSRPPKRPTLGACVRRLTVATSPAVFCYRHQINMRDFKNKPREEVDSLLQKACNMHFEFYMESVTALIRDCLRNVELIAWYDGIRISPATVKAMLDSPVTHLKFNRIQVDQQTMQIINRMPQSKACQLATLDLYISTSLRAHLSEEDESNAVYGFVAYMLQLSASTLTSLRWVDSGFLKLPGTKEGLPKLSNLRVLSLRALSIDSRADIEALIEPDPYCKLVHLELDFPGEATTKYINSRGSMHTLQTFVWSGNADRDEQPLVFLEANAQLKTVSLEYFPMSSIESSILPLLVERFQSLTSLELGSTKEIITLPPSIYNAIAQLKSLEQLCLKAGNQWGWKRTWLVDHDALRSCIRRLTALKRLALCGDIYLRREFQGDAYEHYYSIKYFVPQSDLERRLKQVALFTVHDNDAHDNDAHANGEDTGNNNGESEGSDADEPRQTPLQKRLEWAWEMAHRQKMLREATKYVSLRHRSGPKLEFLYIGQLPMDVKFGWYGWRAHAVTNGRESGWTMLQRMSKGTGDLFSEK